MPSAAWDKASGLGGEHVMVFNTTDDRTWLRTDTSDAYVRSRRAWLRSSASSTLFSVR